MCWICESFYNVESLEICDDVFGGVGGGDGDTYSNPEQSKLCFKTVKVRLEWFNQATF